MWLYLLAVALLVGILFVIRTLLYWKILGVAGPLPYPIVGNIGKNLIGRKNVAEVYTDIYREFKQYPFVGIFRGGTPCILVRDPELIKNITIKDFKHFNNNEIFLDKEVDPLLGRNLFVLKDAEWKRERERSTPGFSSARIKAVFPLVERVSEKMVEYVENEIRLSGNFLNVKEVCTRFTCDNVAVCAFGLEGRCFEESNSEFRELGQKFVAPSSMEGIKFGLSLIVPNLTSLFSLKIVPKEVDDKLLKIVSQTVEYRKSKEIVRNDFMDFVSQLSYSSNQNSLVEITAHLANFFIDGFETSSVVMSHALYELAKYEDSQDKLRNEIKDVLKKHNGIFSYDALQEMTFLDACLNGK
ncbi:hypothetical protein NQ317_012515 [Molorchus minor]|uniref:Cytochrome P450 n=1 Tax=Molorchus minor TaxID=1323400 RepID=A0ABQ9K1F1_9CUCU|nr:hypothetical protein NQ317_012515 [Molorchus minor]